MVFILIYDFMEMLYLALCFNIFCGTLFIFHRKRFIPHLLQFGRQNYEEPAAWLLPLHSLHHFKYSLHRLPAANNNLHAAIVKTESTGKKFISPESIFILPSQISKESNGI